jgi:hypothetical protein
MHLFGWIQLQERPCLVGAPAMKPILGILRLDDDNAALFSPSLQKRFISGCVPVATC